MQRALIDLVATVGDYADDNLLPSLSTPHLGLVAATQMRDVLDHAKRSSASLYQIR